MSISVLLSQVAIALVVVAIYHIWVSRQKHGAPAPPPPAPTVPLVPAAVPAPVVVPVVKAAPAVERVSAETLAVIAAAIAVVVGRPHRVLTVHYAAAIAPEGNAWALEGRVEHFLSHRVR
jgi:acetaldehyde dehydrogenase (acetylating)